MSLDLRVMHVGAKGVSRVWDVKLLDERQNARVHLTPDGLQFIDIVIMGGEHYHPKNIKPKRDVLAAKNKRGRRKALKKKRASSA